jgi:2-desacetyl-2-hydroxyethyl bacteriochlorophyllide A dehydrogenase
LPEPAADEVLVETVLSAISAGTEMLLYRGEIPAAGDAESDPISRGLAYPTAYGYSAVGRIIQAGPSVDRSWLGRLVFAFQPHASHFVAAPSALLEVPPGLEPEEGVFLASAETAVNIVQDAAPILGERALVLGQGVVGLLVTSLLRDFPLESLVTADRYSSRRNASSALGVTAALDPGDPGFSSHAMGYAGADRRGYDFSVELTGSPAALDAAIELTAFSGRVVVGSWFGTKSAALNLGGRYHRSRIRLVASQVSTIAPELSGRWDKARRFATVWKALERIRPSRWITHRLPLEQAPEAYRELDRAPGKAIQVVFQYS